MPQELVPGAISDSGCVRRTTKSITSSGKRHLIVRGGKSDGVQVGKMGDVIDYTLCIMYGVLQHYSPLLH